MVRLLYIKETNCSSKSCTKVKTVFFLEFKLNLQITSITFLLK